MGESLESFHQERERKKFLRQLEIKVDLAFQNRRKLTYLPEQKTTQEYVDQAKQERQLFQDLPDDYILEATEYTEEPYQVSVTNFRDYKDLLIISLRRLAEAGHFEEKKIPQTVQETLEQESQHSIVVQGQKNLQIFYVVEFFEDPQRNFLGIKPSTIISGELSIQTYKDFIGGPLNLSTTDKIKLGSFSG